jgi:4-hydroxy-3-methylbut-2-enyl diphosphate reductase
MLSSESLEVARVIGEAMKDRVGAEALPDHFRSFDTICSATQDRQDAVLAMAADGLDLLLVLGGYNSSNTMQLLTIAKRHTRAYHIEDARNLVSAEIIRHKPEGVGSTEIEDHGWLPGLPAVIGLTAGASTPNRVIHETVERLATFLGLESELAQILGGVPA